MKLNRNLKKRFGFGLKIGGFGRFGADGSRAVTVQVRFPMFFDLAVFKRLDQLRVCLKFCGNGSEVWEGQQQLVKSETCEYADKVCAHIAPFEGSTGKLLEVFG